MGGDHAALEREVAADDARPVGTAIRRRSGSTEPPEIREEFVMESQHVRRDIASERRDRRLTRRKASLLTLLGALVLGSIIGLGVPPLAAQEVPPPPIATELLSGRSVFPDNVDMLLRLKTDGGTEVVKVDDPTRTVTARFTIQPGARFPWHTHAGPVVVNVVQGTLNFIETDCSERPYPAGTAFFDAGHGHVHSAFNPTSGETVIVATFFESPASGPLVIPAATPACAS